MADFPNLKIPNTQLLSKSPKWDIKKYQPMVYNKKVIKLSETLKPGTLAYDDFWSEMDYYCYNGFEPKGMPRISGRHFFYLNFNKIEMLFPGEKRKRMGNPFYRDLDHWLFLELDSAILHGYGLLITKPRRIGLSEFGAVNTAYELTFHARAKVGICAGKEDKALEFYDKLKSSLNNVHPAYRNGRIKANDDLLHMGYTDRINKQNVPCGIQSLARIKTMYADSSAFEGGSYSFVIFEEAGLFENLTKSYKATEPCFKEGGKQFGIPLIYGTGGEIDKGAKGFKTMWDKNKAYNIKTIFVPAYYYYPGDGEIDKKTKKRVSFFNYETGVTNRKLARAHIEAERKKASASKETYTQHVQQYPLLPAEVFLKTRGGTLDIIKLNFQLKEINNGSEPEPVLQGKLEWVDEAHTIMMLQRCKNAKERTKVRLAQGSTVKFVIHEDGNVWKDARPINPNMRHLPYKPDIGACDSYDEEADEDKSELSSGCVMSYRCFSGPSRVYNKPVGVLVERGDGSFDDDIFYEDSVKFAVYWDIEILFEYTKYHILRYFYDVGAHDYIKGRPNIEEAGTDTHKNKDGVKMTTLVKPVLVKLLKAEVRNEIHKCFFQNVILDLINFGDGNTDIAMTYGIALLHKMDIFDEITENIEVGSYDSQSSNQIQDMPQYYHVDLDGNLSVKDKRIQPQMQVFIPERDLNPEEYKEYVKMQQAPYEKIKKKQTDFEKDAKRMGIDPSILGLILSEKDKITEKTE